MLQGTIQAYPGRSAVDCRVVHFLNDRTPDSAMDESMDTWLPAEQEIPRWLPIGADNALVLAFPHG